MDAKDSKQSKVKTKLVFDTNLGKEVPHEFITNHDTNELILRSTKSDHFVKLSLTDLTQEILDNFVNSYKESNDREIITAETLEKAKSEANAIVDSLS